MKRPGQHAAWPAALARGFGTWAARALGPSLLLLVCFCSLPARAADEAGLHIEAEPLLGAGSPAVDGWVETHVRLENAGRSELSGRLELAADRAILGGHEHLLAAAPFAVPGKGRVTLILPSHGLTNRGDQVHVRAVDRAGNVLAEVTLAPFRGIDPLLFDLSVPSRLLPTLGGQAVPWRKRSYGPPVLAVATARLNPSTGDPIVPDLAAGYASATLVLATARTVSRLDPASLDALSSWLLSGGALAVSVDRPEDLQSPWLEALAGAKVRRSAPDPDWFSEGVFAVASDNASGHKGSPGMYPKFSLQRSTPAAETQARLAGFKGGNLRNTPWGAAASYGLGELHLLAFDPNATPFAGDPWVHLKMADLVRHAWERSSVVALPHAQAALDDPRSTAVRRVLDPNQSTRWTVIVSALLLLVYAGVAGPLNFMLAARQGKPLRALWRLPIWAGSALLAIVVLGMLGKGVAGRARHLTLVEAGAGMGKGAATRFRGIYASSASELWVRAARGSVLDVVGDRDDTDRDLVVDRDGLRLERMRTKPWEVVLVREDGFVNLGGGISLLANDKQLLIKNRCAHDLVSVIVKAPGRGLSFFPRLADGQAVTWEQGTLIAMGVSAPAFAGLHALSTGTFRTYVDKHSQGLGAAWDALEALTARDVDWWPDDVPVLLAQLDGGEGKTDDSGLRLDIDRALVRVIGYGGVP